MSKKKSKDKTLFTVLGEIKVVDGKKRFVTKSRAYFDTMLDKAPFGKIISCTFSAKIPTRSQAQLAYHWILMRFISEHSGYEIEEVHDAVMRMKFGTKKVNLANRTVEVRKSISDKAEMPKSDCVELINFDLEICRELGIKVPKPNDLGYTNDGNWIDNLKK